VCETVGVLLLLSACAHPPKPADTGCSPAPVACSDAFTVTAATASEWPAAVAVPYGPVAFAVGDLGGTGADAVLVGTHVSATRLDPDGGVTDLWTQPNDGSAVVPAIADVTGDGQADLLLGLPGSDDGAGQVVVFAGPVSEPVSWDSPHVELKGTADSGVGGVLAVGDLDGDGVADLALPYEGGVWLHRGPASADASLAEDVAFTWEMGEHVPFAGDVGVGDVTGDALADLVFAVPADGACGGTETVRVLAGPVTSGGGAIAALGDVVLDVPAVSRAGGLSLVDVDDDGALDVVLPNSMGVDDGSVEDVLFGPLSASSAAETAYPVVGGFDAEYVGVSLGFVPGGRLDLSESFGSTEDSWAYGPALLTVASPEARSTFTGDVCTSVATQAWAGPALTDFPVPWVGVIDGAPSLLLAVPGEAVVYRFTVP
jgi:hypothetical protein